MSTLTITEFLEARIAEDEATSRLSLTDGSDLAMVTFDEDERDATNVLVIGKDRVLAECAAKRAIIADYIGASPEAWWSQDAIKTNSKRADAWLLTLYHLAAVYKDHPDYRQEWAL